PGALVAVWLIREGAWTAGIDQVYVSGPASKGGLGGSLVRMGLTTIGNRELLGAWLLGLWCVALLGVVGAACLGQTADRTRRVMWASIVAAALGVVYLSALSSNSVEATSRGVTLAAAGMGALTCLTAALYALGAVVRGARD